MHQQLPRVSLVVPEHDLVGEVRQHIVSRDTDSTSESELHERDSVQQLPSYGLVLTETETVVELEECQPSHCDESSFPQWKCCAECRPDTVSKSSATTVYRRGNEK